MKISPADVRRALQVAVAFLLLAISISASPARGGGEHHLLYVASPGVRNYTQFGGVGILVFDIDHGYKFVRRIPTWDVPEGKKPENVKGIAASAKTGMVYVTSLSHVIAINAVTGKKVWDRAYENGCDRLAISPDGKTLYVPEFESGAWHVVDAATGDVITTIETDSGSHNTIYSADGAHVYMAVLRSPTLSVADTKTNKVASTVGPFSNSIRPFTINGDESLVFVNVNGLLGFEVGDLKTGKKLDRVEVQGYKPGPVKLHGCPSHGIALTPDNKELWLADCANTSIHIFDATVMPPKQKSSIKVRDCIGWISFSMDGRYAFAATGEVFDAATKKLVATLKDEAGRDVESEKLLDITIAHGKVVAAGNQFGVGVK